MISVTILVKNGERTLKEALNALKDFDEVLVLDTGSHDKSLEIAKNFSNVRVHQMEFKGFGQCHNQASNLAKHDWILSIDSDEIVSKKLSEQILSLNLDPNTVYSFLRHNYFNKKHIKWCGWHPDRLVRLYHKKKTSFCEAMVHEAVITKDLKKISLRYPVYHYPFASISDFLSKMERYSSLFAEQNKEKRSATPLTAVIHGIWAFFKSYILQRGFLGGFEGFLISSYNAHTAFYKYLKLFLINKKK